MWVPTVSFSDSAPEMGHFSSETELSPWGVLFSKALEMGTGTSLPQGPCLTPREGKGHREAKATSEGAQPAPLPAAQGGQQLPELGPLAPQLLAQQKPQFLPSISGGGQKIHSASPAPPPHTYTQLLLQHVWGARGQPRVT